MIVPSLFIAGPRQDNHDTADIRSDAFGMTRIGLARVDYVLSNFYYFSIFETDGIYGVADPRQGGRIPIRVTRCGMGLPIVDVLKPHV